MRNVWKGLVIGSVAGATIGFILDRTSKDPQQSTNVWKGLVIGSGAGVTVGIVRDKKSKRTNPFAQAVADADLAAKAAELKERAAKAEVVHIASERAREAAQVGSARAREAAQLGTERARGAAIAGTELAREAALAGTDVLHQANEALSEFGNKSLAIVS